MIQLTDAIQLLSLATTELAQWKQWGNHGVRDGGHTGAQQESIIATSVAQPVSTVDQC